MLHQIQELDTQAFLFLNQLHADWLDRPMYWITQTETWIPFYLLLVLWLVKTYKQKSIYMILTLVLTIVLADQFTSSFLKPFVARLRPCHVSYLSDKIHAVTNCGGQYGFASSHAANSFGLATGLLLLGVIELKYFYVILVWAFTVSYSRIYVGVHYPLDVICGAIIGIFCAIISVTLRNRLKFALP